jgi:hypothetical protein
MLRSAGNPKSSETQKESGRRSNFVAGAKTRNAIASEPIDKQVIINMTIRETAITLSARLTSNSIPVTSWPLLRDTCPTNLIPGVEAVNDIDSGTGVFFRNASALTANSSCGVR